MLHYRQVMRDEQVGKAIFLLKLLEKVEYLGTDGNIQC
jgi:hypothetical protein